MTVLLVVLVPIIALFVRRAELLAVAGTRVGVFRFVSGPFAAAIVLVSARRSGDRRGDFARGRQLVRRNAPMAAMESSCVVIV